MPIRGHRGNYDETNCLWPALAFSSQHYGAGSGITCRVSLAVGVVEPWYPPTRSLECRSVGMNDGGGTPYQLELCAWPESSVIEHSGGAHHASPTCTAQRLLLTRDAHVSLSLEYTNLKKQQS